MYTCSGNDTVVGGSAYLKVEDSTGHLIVKGAAGYADINKSGDGNVSFAGAAGGVSIDHLGNHGDVSYGGAAAYNGITRKGLSGNVTFAGAGDTMPSGMKPTKGTCLLQEQAQVIN